jgi:hypothetical protein
MKRGKQTTNLDNSNELKKEIEFNINQTTPCFIGVVIN